MRRDILEIGLGEEQETGRDRKLEWGGGGKPLTTLHIYWVLGRPWMVGNEKPTNPKATIGPTETDRFSGATESEPCYTLHDAMLARVTQNKRRALRSTYGYGNHCLP